MNMKKRVFTFRKVAIAVGIVLISIVLVVFVISPIIMSLKTSIEIIEAFETLNHKVKESKVFLSDDSNDHYRDFKLKKEEFKANGKDISLLEFWERKALATKHEAAKMIGYILNDANEMIKLAEQKDWVMNRDADGNIANLLPLNGLSNMDDYDTPALYFLGDSRSKLKPDPNAAGVKLMNAIHAFRDQVTEAMGTYENDGEKYSFKAPRQSNDLQAAYQTCNKMDTARIGEVYRLLSYPEIVIDNSDGHAEQIPYVSALFYQTPIVAACAMLTSMTVDVRMAEKLIAEFFLSKVDNL